MNLDQELNGPVWDENGGEETEPVGLEDLDASFTSSPQGIDLQPAGPIDIPGPSVYVEEYSGAAEVLSRQKNLYVELWEKDKLYESRKVGGAHYPFSGDEEWEMVKFLNPLTVKQVNEFLKQPYVRSGIFTQTVILMPVFRLCVGLCHSRLRKKCERVSSYFPARQPGRRWRSVLKAAQREIP